MRVIDPFPDRDDGSDLTDLVLGRLRGRRDGADFEDAKQFILRMVSLAEVVERPKPAPPTVASNLRVRVGKWPGAAPDEAAYHGLAGEFVRAIEPHSETDPVAILAQLLVAFGSAIGRGPYFEVESDRHYTNLFLTLVGDSSKGRKGTSWGHVKRSLRRIDEGWYKRILACLSSGEGLIHAVRDPLEKEDGDETKIVDAGVADKRLLVVESEFASAAQDEQPRGQHPLGRSAPSLGRG